MAKHYSSASRNTNYQVYELVCLLRLAGMEIKRTSALRFSLRMGHSKNWTTIELTAPELVKRYGKGTQAYTLLRNLPRAKEVPVAKEPRKAKHMDLVE